MSNQLEIMALNQAQDLKSDARLLVLRKAWNLGDGID